MLHAAPIESLYTWIQQKHPSVTFKVISSVKSAAKMMQEKTQREIVKKIGSNVKKLAISCTSGMLPYSGKWLFAWLI